MIPIILVVLFALLSACLAIYAMRTAEEDPFECLDYAPETPTLPPAIVIHLSVGDRIKDRQPWENEARAKKAWVN